MTYLKLAGAQMLPIDEAGYGTQQKVYERDKRCCYSGDRQNRHAQERSLPLNTKEWQPCSDR
jgi:hypothetical protein